MRKIIQILNMTSQKRIVIPLSIQSYKEFVGKFLIYDKGDTEGYGILNGRLVAGNYIIKNREIKLNIKIYEQSIVVTKIDALIQAHKGECVIELVSSISISYLGAILCSALLAFMGMMYLQVDDVALMFLGFTCSFVLAIATIYIIIFWNRIRSEAENFLSSETIEAYEMEIPPANNV